MSHSERVCRVGSVVLSPIAVLLIIAAIVGVFWMLILGIDWLFPSRIASSVDYAAIHRHSEIIFRLVTTLAGAAILCTFASSMYPVLYSHCRGAEFLAAIEALDAEEAAVQEECSQKLAPIRERRAALMKSGQIKNEEST